MKLKGLILKDLYAMQETSRLVLVLIAVFTLGLFLPAHDLFICMYPSVMIGLLPVDWVRYDEKIKWNHYCAILPVTRGQYVSAKYLLLLCLTGGMVLYSLLIRGILLLLNRITPEEILREILLSVFLILVISAVNFLLVFKWGTEQSRLRQSILLGVSVGFIRRGASISVVGASILFVVGAVIFIVSWRLSIKFYEKREL